MSTPQTLGAFRAKVRLWCERNVPKGWRERRADAPEDALVAFQTGGAPPWNRAERTSPFRSRSCSPMS
jgi:hypothetical protein